jgi:hypothetical protein
MAVPIRQVETTWGPFYARAANGDTVRFTTRSPNTQDPDHHLTLDGHDYSADVELSTLRPRRVGRHYVDETWHTDLDDCAYRLRRDQAGAETTQTADVILSENVLPTLAKWLHTDDGQALLHEGAAHRSALESERATAAQRTPEAALGRGL